MQTETATLLSYLPDKSRDVTIKFADKMMESFTDNLVSVILYGSAAGRQDAASEGNFIEGKSDINILIILQSVRAVDLNIVLDNGKKFFKKGLAVPLVFERDHIKTSLDTFPIEFSDIKNRHIVLFGTDPFEKAEIDGRNLRYQCERELKSMLVNLRRGFVQTDGNREALEALLSKSFSSVLAACRGLIWLAGQMAPDNIPGVLEILKDTYKIDVSAIERVWRLRKGESGATALLEAIFDDYTRNIAKLASVVDNL
jgi:predicted nucleotidyltransferase